MTPSTSVNAFEEFIENRGSALPALTVCTGVAEMLSFYESVAPLGCTIENGDMLLLQWGTYDWGDDPQFEINIARQFMESAAEDNDAISQLQVTFKFPPDKDTAALGNGNRWCNSQSEIQQFREYIFSNRAFLANGLGSRGCLRAPRIRLTVLYCQKAAVHDRQQRVVRRRSEP